MYDMTHFGHRRRAGRLPRVYDTFPTLDMTSFGGFSNIGGYGAAWNNWEHPPQDLPDEIEKATRDHMEAQMECDKAKEKFEEAKKKFEESEKKVQEAERVLQMAKHRAGFW